MTLPPSFNALIQIPQFILWKRIEHDRGIDKVPYDTSGNHKINPHDPQNWITYGEAQSTAVALGPTYGVGFVFTDNDPFFFVDLDHCYDPAANVWDDHTIEILGRFRGACAEWSTSGTGAHIFGTYVPNAIHDGRMIQNDVMGVALYTSKRFVALTGNELYPGFGDSSVDFSDQINNLVSQYLTKPVSKSNNVIDGWTDKPIEAGKGVTTAEDAYRVLMTMRSGKSLFDSNHATPEDLWFANEDKLSLMYPSKNDHTAFDHSSADMALASHLAFVTGGNCQLMWDMMWASGLQRTKWYDRPDYVSDTIIRAVNITSNFYDPNHGKPDPMQPGVKPPTSAPNEAAPISVGVRIMPITQQIEYFKGCVYVILKHRVFTPNGLLLKPEQFKTAYSGYDFAVDQSGNTSKNAFEAFAESRAYEFPKVADTCFRPNLDTGTIIKKGTMTAVNTFVPQFGKQTKGDHTPFLKHMSLLLPIKSDRNIMLDYMAACVQHVGQKFQWAPLIQGVEGNGKTVLYHVLEYALGPIHCHQVDPKDLDNKFNAWIQDTLLVCIEEIRVGGKRTVADALKPLITNSRVAIQSKGSDQTVGDNCANFLLFSNYKDAVLKTISDRRYAVFYTAQQDVDDLTSMGMDRKYFSDLYTWLRTGGGFATVAYYLQNRAVSTDMFQRAPETSSTKEAIEVSGGVADLMLRDAIESELPGFTGGLIDVHDAHDYLSGQGKRYAVQSVASILKQLGYIPHPALAGYSDGRVRVQGRRRRIYVKKNTLAEKLETPTAVAKRWEKNKTEVILNAQPNLG